MNNMAWVAKAAKQPMVLENVDLGPLGIEDVEVAGFKTGIDIEKLVAVREILKSEMPGEALYGGLARAGLPRGRARAA